MIALLVVLAVSSTYGYEKRYERQSGPDQFGYFSRLEFPLIDLRHRLLFEPERADDDIVIVTITETALDRYQSRFGQWPWPRNVMAEVVRYLRHADSILLDIAFVEPGGREISPEEALRMRKLLRASEEVRGEEPGKARDYRSRVRRRLAQLSSDPDRILGRSLREYGPAFSATWFLDVAEGRLSEQKRKTRDRIRSKFGYRLLGNEGVLPRFSTVTSPVKPVLENSYGLAHISFTPDPDGPARRFRPFAGLEESTASGSEGAGDFLPILGLSGALEEWGIDPGEGTFAVGEKYLKVGGRKVPLDRKKRALIRYRGGLHPRDSVYASYTEVPVETIVENLLGESERGPAPDFFKGKKVLVGSTASGAHDLRATPFSAREAGVAIHANVLDMFLNNDFLHPIETSDTLRNVVLWTMAVGVIATVLSPVIALVLTVLLSVLFVVMGLGLFRQGYLINLTAPLFSVYVTYAFVTVYGFAFEKRKRREVRNAFESYLAPSVMEEVLREPDALELGGERREITVMFADVSGFTNFSEGRSATEVASVIGNVMTEMTECVFRYDGVLDKYIGDEMVAEFGIVPGEPSDHAGRAVNAAVDMLESLETLRTEWRRAGQAVLDLRIGLHTGHAATGNMGSEMLFDYTAIGDNVNLGSRLEGANKQYGTRSMISGETYHRVEDLAEVRELDKIIVKGRDEPVTVYELLGRRGEVDDETLNLRDVFREGLERYRERRWDDAVETFEGLLEKFPDDGPAGVFLERARRYRENPPPEDWNGVFRMTTK